MEVTGIHWWAVAKVVRGRARDRIVLARAESPSRPAVPALIAVKGQTSSGQRQDSRAREVSVYVSHYPHAGWLTRSRRRCSWWRRRRRSSPPPKASSDRCLGEHRGAVRRRRHSGGGFSFFCSPLPALCVAPEVFAAWSSFLCFLLLFLASSPAVSPESLRVCQYCLIFRLSSPVQLSSPVSPSTELPPMSPSFHKGAPCSRHVPLVTTRYDMSGGWWL